MQVDLVAAGYEPVPGEDGVFVPLFADLKRHDMGDGLKEDFAMAEISNREFTTARLWGVADTAPYLHDGRATTLAQAILAHGGAGRASRDAFDGLLPSEQRRLVVFFQKMRTPIRPNEELLHGPVQEQPVRHTGSELMGYFSRSSAARRARLPPPTRPGASR